MATRHDIGRSTKRSNPDMTLSLYECIKVTLRGIAHYYRWSKWAKGRDPLSQPCGNNDTASLMLNHIFAGLYTAQLQTLQHHRINYQLYRTAKQIWLNLRVSRNNRTTLEQSPIKALTELHAGWRRCILYDEQEIGWASEHRQTLYST